jgi:UDP-N-acetylmuramyl tripeptide synthase
MSEVASKYADKIYLTADDPQFEVVRDICNELATYLTVPYEIIEDRKEAIHTAYNNMKDNGVLCLLAKGEDRYQQVKGKLEDYESDVDIAKDITKEG